MTKPSIACSPLQNGTYRFASKPYKYLAHNSKGFFNEHLASTISIESKQMFIARIDDNLMRTIISVANRYGSPIRYNIDIVDNVAFKSFRDENNWIEVAIALEHFCAQIECQRKQMEIFCKEISERNMQKKYQW